MWPIDIPSSVQTFGDDSSFADVVNGGDGLSLSSQPVPSPILDVC